MAGLLTPKPCKDCGSDPVFHRLTRWSISIESLLGLFSIPGEKFSQISTPITDRVFNVTLPPLFNLLEKMGAGTTTYEVDDQDFKYVTHVLWEEADKRGIKMRQFRPFNMVKHIFIAEYDGKQIVFERIPVPVGVGRGVSWIDDKADLKKVLMAHNLPTARGRAVSTRSAALSLFNELRKPVIVKPHQGSGTRHTTLHITNEQELIAAFDIAKRVSPQVMIEEELTGPVYRPTVVGGKLVATIERNQPAVSGDGISSIAELIAKENEHEKRQGPIFSHITITDTTTAELARQGFVLDSIPPKGTRVELHQKINWSVGGHTRDVTDDVHPDNRALFEEVARLVDAPVVGIDFIIGDISKSWKDQEMCGVIETNSMPFFDTHHVPFEGKPQNVAAAIWEEVFPTK